MSEADQTEMDTRTNIETKIDDAVGNAIDYVFKAMDTAGVGINPVRNRHEAYGIAAEHLTAINGSCKRIKGDMDKLLQTLPDPNYPALEATSAIVNSMTAGAAILVKAAAVMKKTLNDLYEEEYYDTDEDVLPLEQAADGGFDEAENIEDEGEN